MNIITSLLGGNNDQNTPQQKPKSKDKVTATARIKRVISDDLPALQLEISGTITPGTATKGTAKRCIMFVIDKSGSMGGSRITTVREAVIPFVEDVCENKDVMIKVIMFESNAVSHDIPNDKSKAKVKLEQIIQSSGGTDFARASDEMVRCGKKILKNHPNYQLTVIICSDGEVSKSNAQQAHKTWKTFINDYYMKQHQQYPFVESIGISSNHDADILDGFILNDDNGNYSRATDSEEIKESFNRAAENATLRTTYKLNIVSPNNSNIMFISNLYNGNNTKLREFTINDTDFVLNIWCNKKQLQSIFNDDQKQNDNDLMITINDNTSLSVSISDIVNLGSIQGYIIDYYHQILKDMINALRNLSDESLLKAEAKKIQLLLDGEYVAIFNKITSSPSELAVLEKELNDILNNCSSDMDEIEKRAQKLKHYKKVRKSWKGHSLIVNSFNSTLKSLKDLLIEILTGKTRMQEIRQHILNLHFSKKHAKRINKLILTDEQLIKRQLIYDNIKPPNDDDIKDLSDEYGSGCFLSTLTLKDLAEEAEPLWLCGRVNRKGGAMVSNPEIIRIEYISPDLCSNEYFNMAINVKKDGFYDGSRNIINSRLFPVYGNNISYLKVTLPHLFETLSHTLSGRNDIKINEYSTLSAVLGHMIAKYNQTENNLVRIFNDILPSYKLLANYCNVFPYANTKNKEINFKNATKIKLVDLFKHRLERYCNNMQVRCTSLISNIQCLFGDALLTDAYPILLDKKKSTVVWFTMLQQRLRSIIKNRIPGDMSMYTAARLAEKNHSEALRVIIRGTDNINDTFSAINKDDDGDDDEKKINDDFILKYFETEYAKEKDLKKERLAAFDIPVCEALSSDNMDFSTFDPYKITPSQIQLCAQILARINFRDLIAAHRFFRVLNEIKINCNNLNELDNIIISNVNKFKLNNNNVINGTLTELCTELGYKFSPLTLRSLCGFVLLYYTNSIWQKQVNYELFCELITSPSIIIQHLHEKVIAESKRKPRRMVARIKNKPTSPVDLSKRKQHNNILECFCFDIANKSYWNNNNMVNIPSSLTVSIIGSKSSGKSSLCGRLLVDCGAISTQYYKKKQNIAKLNWSQNEFTKIINGTPSQHSSSFTVIKSSDSSSQIRLIDSTNISYFKNVIKHLNLCNLSLLVIPSSINDYSKAKIFGTVSKTLVSSDKIICCISKMDLNTINYSEKKYEIIKNNVQKLLIKRGFKDKKIIFIPISSLTSANDGNNIFKENISMKSWYSGWKIKIKKQIYNGKTVFDALNLFAKLNKNDIELKKKIQNPKLFVIGKYKIKGVGNVIQCYVIEGTISINDQIKFIPSDVIANIKTMERNWNNIKIGYPGDMVTFKLNQIQNNKNEKDIIVGDICILNNNKNNIISSKKEISALIFVTSENCTKRFRNGFSSHLFIGSDHVPCSLKKIKWKIGLKTTNNKKVTDPLYIENGDQAEVVISLQKSCAVSKYDDFKYTGRFITVNSSAPVFIGKII